MDSCRCRLRVVYRVFLLSKQYAVGRRFHLVNFFLFYFFL